MPKPELTARTPRWPLPPHQAPLYLAACLALSSTTAPLLAQAQQAAPEATQGSETASGNEGDPAMIGDESDFPDIQARSHFRLGKQYYDQGRFEEAAAEFEVAHGLSGRQGLLYNVYLAHREAQNLRKAAAALRGYLVDPNVPDRVHLESRLEALDAQIAAEDEAAAKRKAALEQAEQERVAAEQQRIAAEASRKAAEERAEAIAAQRPTRPIWPWFIVGGGAVAAGTGIALGVLAKNDADELKGDCVLNPRTEGATGPLSQGDFCAPSVDLESRRNAIQTQATIADALWIGGAVVGVTGLILAWALPDEYEDIPPVAASCTPSRCDATLTLRF